MGIVIQRPMIDLRTIGSILRAKREEMGLTIYDVGEAVGVTGGYISSLERGVGNPTISVLQKIATAVKADIDFRIVFPDGDPLDAALSALDTDERAWVLELASLARRTPADTRRATLTMLHHSTGVVRAQAVAS